MKKFILVLGLIFSFNVWAKVESKTVMAKVISFDQKTVTLEIAGKNHKFDREKLGKQFTALKKGEMVEIDTDGAEAPVKK